MNQPALIELSSVKKQNAQEIGQRALSLAEAQSHGLPITATAVIPTSAIEYLVKTSQLEDKLSKLFAHLNLDKLDLISTLAMVQQQIRRLEVPDEISRAVISWYQRHPGFIKVFSGDDEIAPAHSSVRGEANLIDSILTVWSENVDIDLKKGQLQVFAEPIILQWQGIPSASGYALTTSPNNKQQLQIYSVWGSYQADFHDIEPDLTVIDQRTHQVVQTKTEPQYLKLAPQLDGFGIKHIKHFDQSRHSLEKTQATHLGQMLTKLKRLHFQDQKVEWMLVDRQLLLTHLEPLSRKDLELSPDNQVVLRGDVLQPGIATGQVALLTPQVKLPPHQPHILVTSQLRPSHLELLGSAQAVICEQGVTSPAVFQYIKKRQLPTIVNVHRASQLLKDDQEIIVDANSGRVMQLSQRKKLTTKATTPTIAKVFISAGNPAKAAKYVSHNVDGVGVLRSEFTYASLGDHPEFLIKSKQKHQVEAALLKTLSAFNAPNPQQALIYRSHNLTSQELGMLNYSLNYEPEELNPFMGFRGGIRLLKRFELLDFELNTLEKYLQTHQHHLGYMLPFIRTPGEMKLITQHIHRHQQLVANPNFGLYLQLSTPANVMMLDKYLQTNLAGVAVDVSSLQALLDGVDPDNPELTPLYPLNVDLIFSLLKDVASTCQKQDYRATNQARPPKLMLIINEPNTRLIELAISVGFDIITVKPQFASRVKHQIRELEAQKMKDI